MSGEAEQTAKSLRELGRLADRTRHASRSIGTGFPLVGWGIAWIVGLAALDLLDGGARIAVAALAWLIGILLSWLPMRTVIRTGAESRLRSAWGVVLVASPFFVLAAHPASFVYGVLLLGALWGLAMCLYAVATQDLPYAAVAGFGVVASGVLAVPELSNPLLWFGVCAGAPMLALGAYRVFDGARRV